MYYYKSSKKYQKPVTVEYDYEENKYFIVDGNHRVAYHILKNYEYIPVIIIFKKLQNKRKAIISPIDTQVVSRKSRK